MQSVARQNGMQWVVPRAAGLHLLCCTGGVVRAGEGGVVGDIDNGEGAARCLGLVGAGVVEGAAVVEGDAAGGHVHGHRFGHVVALVFHLVDDTLAFYPEFDCFEAAVLVRAGYEVQAAVCWGHVVDRDPGRQRADGFHRPIGRVLVPVGLFAFLSGRFDHRVVVVDAHVAAIAEQAGTLCETGMEGDFLGGLVVGPEIDHLVKNALVFV